MFNVIGSDVGL